MGKTAKMTFHLIDNRNSVEAAMAGRVPPGSRLLSSDDVDPNGQSRMYLIRKRVMVSGDTLIDSQPSTDGRTNEPVVTFRFDTAGAKRFGLATSKNVGKLFAIVLDGKVISAPVIREPILGGSGQISGSFTFQSAQDLALLLRAGALPAPLTILEERSVGPGLGADSIAAGKIASILGMIAVLVFMAAAYGLFGFMADVALVVNMVLILGVLSFLQATLTLPGIAGIVLTIGMAVDANVLIFERIREELRVGKSLKGAISSGYEKAFGTIFDANLTTLIASVILIYMGKGPVQGFGVTLTIGILASMFTALVVTRLVLDLLLNWGWIGSEGSKRAMHLRPTAGLPTIKFVKYKTSATRVTNAIKSPAVWITWLFILFSTIYVISRGWDKTMGVDFAGGQSLMMSFDNDKATINSEKLQADLSEKLSMGDSGLKVQPQTDHASGKQVLHVSYKNGNATRVNNELNRIYPDANFTLLSKDGTFWYNFTRIWIRVIY